MKRRFIKFISLISALILVIVPASVNAQSNKNFEQEFHEVVNKLNLEGKILETEFIPLDEIPSNSEMLDFETMEDFVEFLSILDKDIKSENYEIEHTIEHFKDGEWVEIDKDEYNQIISQTDISTQSYDTNFADYFREKRLVVDKRWWVVAVAKLESQVYYGIERTAPRAKFIVSDDIYPVVNAMTEFKGTNQTAYVSGTNDNKIVVRWDTRVYLTASVAGQPIGALLMSPFGQYFL